MSESFRFATEVALSRPSDDPNALVSLDLLASAGIDLPGLRTSVDRFGLGVRFVLRLDRQGRAGLIDYVVEVREPTGLAAELLLPGATGGGYLAKVGQHELRGVLSASLGVVQVSGFGVLGLDRFSLLVLLAAEFEPPLQLSFGFTLVGVGGLIGIERGVDEAALVAAVSSGDLSHLLFPRDPVAEAPRLLEVLSGTFPYASGGVLVGPMVKLGWGTPTIISATLALVVSTADECVLLFGRLAISLPFEALPLIHLEALVVGRFDANGVAIDASLANSHVIGMPVDGELRLRIRSGRDALFALAIGGFHPAFPPPVGMAGMRRLSTTLSPGPFLHLRLEGYAAITTGSVQFGARVELTAGIDGFGIHGFAQFDALLVWEPTFGFTTRLTASVSVVCADFDVASVSLVGELSGPAPWRIHGSASITLLFFEVDVTLPTISWGPSPAVEPPARDPLAIIAEELARPENWSAAVTDVPPLVRLRSNTGAEPAVHPLGAVGFRQKAIPLATEIGRADGRHLPRPISVQVAAGEGVATSVVSDSFVPAQFLELDENARLTQSGYVELPAGLTLGAPVGTPPAGAIRNGDYEVKELHGEAGTWKRLRLLDPPLYGPRFRAPVAEPVLVETGDPHRAVVAAVGLTDAAGRSLLVVPAWEARLQ